MGFGIGTIGLGKIVGYTVPWLMLVYPAIIVLLVGSLFDFDKFKPALQGAIVTAVILSIGDFLGAMGMADNPFSSLTAKLPLGGQGLGWLVPALVGALAMFFAGRSKNSGPGGWAICNSRVNWIQRGSSRSDDYGYDVLLAQHGIAILLEASSEGCASGSCSTRAVRPDTAQPGTPGHRPRSIGAVGSPHCHDHTEGLVDVLKAIGREMSPWWPTRRCSAHYIFDPSSATSASPEERPRRHEEAGVAGPRRRALRDHARRQTGEVPRRRAFEAGIGTYNIEEGGSPRRDPRRPLLAVKVRGRACSHLRLQPRRDNKHHRLSRECVGAQG